jgi:hypothetical protein
MCQIGTDKQRIGLTNRLGEVSDFSVPPSGTDFLKFFSKEVKTDRN